MGLHNACCVTLSYGVTWLAFQPWALETPVQINFLLAEQEIVKVRVAPFSDNFINVPFVPEKRGKSSGF